MTMSANYRRMMLTERGLSADLLAVDPVGCGCTECIIGEYIPADQVAREQIPVFQNLIRDGVLDDHTDGWFMPSVSAEQVFTREDMARAWREGRECWDLTDADNPYGEA